MDLFRAQGCNLVNPRHPDLRLRYLQWEGKAFGQDSDDCDVLAIDGEDSTEKAFVAAEVAVPEAVADQGHIASTELFFFCKKRAAQRRHDSQSAEKIERYSSPG